MQIWKLAETGVSIKEVIRKHKADLVLFQETKLCCMNVFVIKELWGCNSVDQVCFDATGSSEDILMYWDNRSLVARRYGS